MLACLQCVALMEPHTHVLIVHDAAGRAGGHPCGWCHGHKRWSTHRQPLRCWLQPARGAWGAADDRAPPPPHTHTHRPPTPLHTLAVQEGLSVYLCM